MSFSPEVSLKGLTDVEPGLGSLDMPVGGFEGDFEGSYDFWTADVEGLWEEGKHFVGDKLPILQGGLILREDGGVERGRGGRVGVSGARGVSLGGFWLDLNFFRFCFLGCCSLLASFSSLRDFFSFFSLFFLLALSSGLLSLLSSVKL